MLPIPIRRFPRAFACAALAAALGSAAAIDGLRGRVPTTENDFLVPGTQSGDISANAFIPSSNCQLCHGNFEPENSPHSTWKGSLMGIAALDPLFQAQVALANQDAPGVGYYCLRCHAPTSIISGRAHTGTIEGLQGMDFDGVSCHLCHAMIDPNYVDGSSPSEDPATLDTLERVPQQYGNAMFVLDKEGLRRGPRTDTLAAHQVAASGFFKDGNLCGTCHEVGNVAISRQPDGTYFYNPVDAVAPDPDPGTHFPLERTFSEWRLSAFANGGVDMGDRYGGTGSTTVSTCQDCHMPKAASRACSFGPVRPDMARHTFAGATAWVLEITALRYPSDARVDLAALERGRLEAIAMVKRAADIEFSRLPDALAVRVINQSGHKFPTGHIEGRRAWLNLRFFGPGDSLLAEYGAYDRETAELVRDGTRIYEMQVGISPEASELTGLPVGITGHMSLANTIEKDTRIPPRGFDPEAFAAAGAPAVGYDFAAGQYWDEHAYPVPEGAVRAEARVYYQTVTREYIEELRDNNVTNDAGTILYELWMQTEKCAPIEVSRRDVLLEDYETTMWALW